MSNDHLSDLQCCKNRILLLYYIIYILYILLLDISDVCFGVLRPVYF